jgi:hypothetical protein
VGALLPTESAQGTRRGRWIAALVIAVLGGAVFGPLLGRIGTHFIGREYVDHYGTQWFYWFVDQQVAQGELMGHTDLFFHPFGKDIFGHTGANVLDALLFIPFRAIFGPTLGYNAFILVGLLATAVAFWRLVRLFTDDPIAVGVSTGLMTFTPFVLLELLEGRPTQGLLLFPVLFVHAAWRTGTRRGLVAPIAAGVFLALCGYQYWYYAFFGGIAALAMGLVRIAWPPDGAGERWRVLGRYALIAAVSMALCLPVGLPLLGLGGAETMDVPGLLDTAKWSLLASPPITQEAQTVGLFLWQPLRHATGFFVMDGLDHERFLSRSSYVPWIVFPLAGLYLWNPGKLHRGPLLALLLATGAVALGPFLLVDQIGLPNPVYIGLLKALVFMRRLWWPARAFAFTAIALGLVVGIGLAALRRHGPRWQIPAAAGVVFVWGLELSAQGLAPFPAWADTIPAGYRCLATGPAGALIELPYGWNQAHLYYQTHHGRPVFGGMIEDNEVFTPAGTRALHDDNTFVARMIGAARLDRQIPPLEEAHQAEVYALGFRYVVLQKDAHVVKGKPDALFDDAIRARLRGTRKTLRQMLGPPVFEDARVVIYAPWGEPAPCDAATIGIDREAAPTRRYDRLPTEIERERQLILRLFSPPPAADEPDTGTAL